MSFYAVASGRKIGIYDDWKSCEEQVKGYKRAKFKKFATCSEAEAFLKQHSLPISKDQYEPEDHTVPLGVKVIDKQVEDVNRKSEDDSITDENLQNAENRKRKNDLDTDSTSSSKISKNESLICEPVVLKQIEGKEFIVDSEGYVIVCTGGLSLHNDQKNAHATHGVNFGDNRDLNCEKPLIGRITHNLAEIEAAIDAIKIAKTEGINKICLCTNSQDLINSVTLLKELGNLLQDKSIDVKWNYVETLKGINGNEKVD